MKTLIRFIAKVIYRALVGLDKALNRYERYDYETAPYCGHHHDGHDGYFTRSHYHEGDGGGESIGWFSRYIFAVHYSNIEGHLYYFSVPAYMWCRWFYYELKHFFRYAAIKIDYPLGKRTLYINWVHLRSRRGSYSRRTKYTSALHVVRLRWNIVPVSHSTVTL